MTASRPDGHTPVILIDGPPRVGKSTLALRGANDAVHLYPDGTLFADLCGHADHSVVNAGDVLEQFLLALGVPALAMPHTLDARASL